MREALLFSLRAHLSWWFDALDVRGRYLAPLSMKRCLLLFVGYPLFLLLQAIHWVGFLLDELFFRDYRKVEIKEPLFITGVPRSGTTFVHRALGGASNEFTTLETWEALLAPSITGRHVIRWIARMDNKLKSRPLHRLSKRIATGLTGSFDEIHEVGLRAPEEDYLTLLPLGACFIMVLAFPASRSLWQLGRFQEMPTEQREIIVRFYHSCMQRHLYFHGQERRLLSKNAAFGSWLPDLRRAFPDARYLVCIREPGSALSSQLSSIRPGLEAFGTMPSADTCSLEIQTVLAHVYRILRQEKRTFLVDHMAILDQGRLKADSSGQIRAALRQLCIRIDDELDASIRRATQSSNDSPPGHIHRPISDRKGPEEFNSMVADIYEEILEEPYMTPNE